MDNVSCYVFWSCCFVKAAFHQQKQCPPRETYVNMVNRLTHDLFNVFGSGRACFLINHAEEVGLHLLEAPFLLEVLFILRKSLRGPAEDVLGVEVSRSMW